MKTVVLALILGLPVTPQATPPPGVHREAAPAREPMKRFSWRDEAAGYTFVAPPRWAGKVRAEPLKSEELATSGATGGVRFLEGSKTLLVLLSTDETRLQALTRTGASELSRKGDHVVAVKMASDVGELALTNEELASAIQWDDGAKGTAER
ncbi:hypothetical protein [Luteibacter yeojuensis]|uniref:Uncharacterized protein n=1 Tax=Luteibacter yeojuensis TaxID=345309 RepID=A0A7X5QRH2_9GAMM|nr:hypothetical protein [Luteibacter yeojuensis]NID14061.1 hypothetical protein [Luteibacter yeojuensis]